MPLTSIIIIIIIINHHCCFVNAEACMQQQPAAAAVVAASHYGHVPLLSILDESNSDFSNRHFHVLQSCCIPFSRLFYKRLKVKRYSFQNKSSPSYTKHHLPYGITHFPPDTSEHTPPLPQPDRLILHLPAPEGWKAELT